MLVYIAAPYSSIPDKVELMRRISKFCGEYMIAHPGEYAIPGLVHHYPTLECPNLGTDYKFWQNFCEVFLARCDKMVVLKFPGWENSSGVKAEIEFCQQHGIPFDFRDI